MKKIIKILLFFFFFFFLLLVFFSLNLEEEVPYFKIEEPKKETEYRLIEEEKIGQKELYQFNISYPLLEGGDVELINNDIKLFINQIINEFEQNLIGPNLQEGNFLEINYSIARFDKKILSIEFLISSDYIGSPRPITFIRSLNYNLEKKTRFNLIDCFDDLIVVSEHVKGDLTNRFSDIFWEKGAEPLKRNFENFVVLNDSFEILFSPYQVTPFSEGVIRSTISFSDFKNIITCNFIF